MNTSNATIMTNTAKSISIFATFYSYYCLSVIICGTIFNLLTIVVFCRSIFRNTKARPTTHYMRAIAVVDCVGLYGWTLDGYLYATHGFTLNYTYTVASCKFFYFLNFWTLQTSAWLHVFVAFDRYLFMSRVQPTTWFNRSKSVLIVITCIMTIFLISNFPLLILVCYRNTSGYIIADYPLYPMVSTFQSIHLWIYDLIPAGFILSFNFLSIYHLYKLRRTTIITNSKIRHRPITITLIINGFLCVITRTPASLNYAFFYPILSASERGNFLINVFNLLLYTSPVLNFPIYLTTSREFRHELVHCLRRRATAAATVRDKPVQIVQIKVRSIPNTRDLQ